jgi:hypothetical protein
LVVLGCVEFFGAEKLGFPILPGSLQHVDVEERFEFGWNVLEKSENTPFWMLVPERIKDEAFLRDERVAVSAVPVGY